MKKARLKISARTRLEYSKVIEVEDNTTKAQLEEMALRLFDETEGGEFYEDPDYFEQGDCWGEFIENDSPEVQSLEAIAAQVDSEKDAEDEDGYRRDADNEGDNQPLCCPKCNALLFMKRYVETIHPIVNSDHENFQVGGELFGPEETNKDPDLFCRECGFSEAFTAWGYDIV